MSLKKPGGNSHSIWKGSLVLFFFRLFRWTHTQSSSGDGSGQRVDEDSGGTRSEKGTAGLLGGRPRGIDIIDQQDLLPLNLLWLLDGKGILEVLELLRDGKVALRKSGTRTQNRARIELDWEGSGQHLG